MVGGHNIDDYTSNNGNQGGTYIVPLSFWFSSEISQSIPLVALQYSEVEFRIKFKDFDDLWLSSNGQDQLETTRLISFKFL